MFDSIFSAVLGDWKTTIVILAAGLFIAFLIGWVAKLLPKPYSSVGQLIAVLVTLISVVAAIGLPVLTHLGEPAEAKVDPGRQIMIGLPSFDVASYKIGTCQTDREMTGPEIKPGGIPLPMSGPPSVRGNAAVVVSIGQRDLSDYTSSATAMPASELPADLAAKLPAGTDKRHTVAVVLTLPHSKILQVSMEDGTTAPEGWNELPLYQRLSAECDGLTHITDTTNGGNMREWAGQIADVNEGALLEQTWRRETTAAIRNEISSGQRLFDGKTATEAADGSFETQFSKLAQSLSAKAGNASVVYLVKFDDTVRPSGGPDQLDITQAVDNLPQGT